MIMSIQEVRAGLAKPDPFRWANPAAAAAWLARRAACAAGRADGSIVIPSDPGFHFCQSCGELSHCEACWRCTPPLSYGGLVDDSEDGDRIAASRDLHDQMQEQADLAVREDQI